MKTLGIEEVTTAREPKIRLVEDGQKQIRSSILNVFMVGATHGGGTNQQTASPIVTLHYLWSRPGHIWFGTCHQIVSKAEHRIKFCSKRI